MPKHIMVSPLIAFSLPVLAFLCLCTLGCGKTHSEHSEAIRLIEKYWSTDGRYHVLPIGEVQIVKSDWHVSKGQTSPAEIHAYEVLRRQKAIVISSNIDLTASNNFSWDNFFSLSQKGVVRKLTVSLAASQDKKLLCPDFFRKRLGTDNIICVDSGSGSIQEVVRSQKFQIGTKQYWLIMGNHRWKWSDIGRQIRDAQGEVTDENMKFMVIAQYEDFTKEWQLDMFDYAPRTGQFARQEQFDAVLSRARIEGAPSQ